MIPVARLTRVSREDEGIFGVVTLNNKVVCLTLENPDLEICEGIYRCAEDNTGRHQWWRLEDRHGRKDIEIHIGNTEDSSKGCILFGSYFGQLKGKKAVINSGGALEKFKDALQDHDKFDLVITNNY